MIFFRTDKWFGNRTVSVLTCALCEKTCVSSIKHLLFEWSLVEQSVCSESAGS